MFELQIAKGVEYLNKELGTSWIDRIELEELDLADCYYCVIGQLFGDFYDKFFSASYTVKYGFCLPIDAPLVQYKQLTQEWKDKIVQLRTEREEL